MAKRKDKMWLIGGVEECIYLDLGLFLKCYQLNYEALLFYKALRY